MAMGKGLSTAEIAPLRYRAGTHLPSVGERSLQAEGDDEDGGWFGDQDGTVTDCGLRVARVARSGKGDDAQTCCTSRGLAAME